MGKQPTVCKTNRMVRPLTELGGFALRFRWGLQTGQSFEEKENSGGSSYRILMIRRATAATEVSGLDFRAHSQTVKTRHPSRRSASRTLLSRRLLPSSLRRQ